METENIISAIIISIGIVIHGVVLANAINYQTQNLTSAVDKTVKENYYA